MFFFLSLKYHTIFIETIEINMSFYSTIYSFDRQDHVIIYHILPVLHLYFYILNRILFFFIFCNLQIQKPLKGARDQAPFNGFCYSNTPTRKSLNKASPFSTNIPMYVPVNVIVSVTSVHNPAVSPCPKRTYSSPSNE